MLRRHRKTRPLGAHMGAGAAGQLTRGGFIAADGFGDFIKAYAEHVMQQKRGALERRQTFQRQHQRQGDVIHLVFLGREHRLRQPRPDIDFAVLATGRLQHIQAKPGHHLTQIRFRLAYCRRGRRHASAGTIPALHPPRPRPNPACDRRCGSAAGAADQRRPRHHRQPSGSLLLENGRAHPEADAQAVETVDHHDRHGELDLFLGTERINDHLIIRVGRAGLGQPGQRFRPG